MAEDLATLGLEINSSGVKEGIEALKQFQGAAKNAEAGAQQLVSAAQRLNVTVPQLKNLLSQAIDAQDLDRVKSLKILIDDLSNAYQIAGTTGAQKLGELRGATQAVADAMRSIGSGNAGAIAAFDDQMAGLAEAFEAVNKQATLLVSGAIREIGKGNTADIEQFNEQIENMGEAFEAANRQATLLVSGAIREIGRGETAQIEQFNAQIRNMGKAFEDVNKQATLLVSGAIREIGKGNTADIEQFNRQMANMHTAFEDVDETATLAAATGIRQFGKSLDETEDSTNNLLGGLSLFRYYMAFEIARGLATTVTNVLEAGEKLRELATTAGLTTDAFQKLSFAALQVGIDGDRFSTFFDFLDRAIGSAQHGAPAVVHAFNDIGVSVHDLFSLSPEQIFYKMADGMAKLTAAQKELALTQLGGRGGKQFGVLFGPEGSAAIKRTGDQAPILTQEDVRTSEDFTRSARTLWQEMETGAQKAALAVWRWRQGNVDSFAAMGIGSPSTLSTTAAQNATAKGSGPGVGTPAPDNNLIDYSNQAKDLIATMREEITVENEKAEAEKEGGIAIDLVTGKIKAKKAAQEAGLPLDDPSVMRAMATAAQEYATAMNSITTNRNFRNEAEELTRETEAEEAKTSALGLGAAATEKATLASQIKTAQDKLGADASLEDRIAIALQVEGLNASTQAYDKKQVAIAAANKENDAESKALADLISHMGGLSSVQRTVSAEMGLVEQGFKRGTISAEEFAQAQAGAAAALKKPDFTESARANSDEFIHSFNEMGDAVDSLFDKLGEHTKHQESLMDELRDSALKMAHELGKAAFDDNVVAPLRHDAEALLHPYFSSIPGPPNTNTAGKNGAPGLTNTGTGFTGLAHDATAALGLTRLSNWIGGGASAPTSGTTSSGTSYSASGGSWSTTPATSAVNASALPGTPGSSVGVGSNALPGATATTVGTLEEYLKNIGTGGGYGTHGFSTPAPANSAAPGVTATGPGGATYAVNASGNLVATNAVGSASSAASSIGSAISGFFSSFDEGSWELGRDQLANVHKGEMIIPRGPADALRSGSSLGAAAARERADIRSVGTTHTSGGGRDRSAPTYNQVTINANDAGSFHASKRQTMADLASAMHRSR